MDKEDFVRKIIERVKLSARNSMELNLEKPAGREPDPKLKEMSVWFNNLDAENRKVLFNIIEDTIDETIFGFFCVLDGVRNIGVDGQLELYYTEKDKKNLLNTGSMDFHDIYNSLV